MTMEMFYTRERANEGIEVPLYTPDGQKTEHWMRIRGVDSDAFRLAEADSRRDAMRIAAIEDEKERSKEIAEAKLRLIAALVMDWSFDEECNEKNVIEFLRQAPQIADVIDQIAGKRALFFAKKSSSSQNLPSTNSGSTKSRRGQNKASAPA